MAPGGGHSLGTKNSLPEDLDKDEGTKTGAGKSARVSSDGPTVGD